MPGTTHWVHTTLAHFGNRNEKIDGNNGKLLEKRLPLPEDQNDLKQMLTLVWSFAWVEMTLIYTKKY